MTAPPVHVALSDGPDGERTAAALLGALAGRLALLRLMSGADALGSVLAGYAAVGRQAAQTADGARLRRALTRGRAAANGKALWAALGLDELAQRAPSPVLQDLRNDVALLLADDLEAELRGPIRPRRGAAPPETAPVEVVDYLVGMWACSAETVRVIDAIAGLTPSHEAVVAAPPSEPDGPLLR